jgi:hypothetical protein
MLLVIASMPRYLAEASNDLIDVILADGQVRQVRESEVAALLHAGARLAGAAETPGYPVRFAGISTNPDDATSQRGIVPGVGELASAEAEEDLIDPAIAGTEVAADGEKLAKLDENNPAPETTEDGKSEQDRTRRPDWLRTLGLDPDGPDKPLLPRNEDPRQRAVTDRLVGPRRP